MWAQANAIRVVVVATKWKSDNNKKTLKPAEHNP
jgi:hypothetical protein